MIGLDQDALLAAAVEANAVVVIAAHPGGSLVQGTPLASLVARWGADRAGVGPIAGSGRPTLSGSGTNERPRRTSDTDCGS